ncbi:hypothetical protein [Verrucomicrobium sp. BvORR034]|uniref:hypothetical protein n=1 Tax=Verrucomicrobium sp. BvORR034 TaxID=1396418 RepID=UPI000679A2DE|nr:hypothetical protein [Verrucomicrobium sp. BvORR034]
MGRHHRPTSRPRTDAGPTYKDYASATSNGDTTISGNRGWRHFIDAKKTLLQWEDKFNGALSSFIEQVSTGCRSQHN